MYTELRILLALQHEWLCTRFCSCDSYFSTDLRILLVLQHEGLCTRFCSCYWYFSTVNHIFQGTQGLKAWCVLRQVARLLTLWLLACRITLAEGQCMAAIKTVDVSKSLQLVPALVWEAQVLQLLAHVPCVPKKLAVGSMTGGLCYFLASTLLSGQRPSAKLMQAGLRDCARDALSAIHAAGVLHGDIRLDNMLVVSRTPGSSSSSIMFLDFGRAMHLPSTTSRRARQKFAAEHEELDALMAARCDTSSWLPRLAGIMLLQPPSPQALSLSMHGAQGDERGGGICKGITEGLHTW